MAATWWFRRRVEIAWRERLTHELHAAYFRDGFFFRQTTGPGAIADPGQRIVRDVNRLVEDLTRFCQSTVSGMLAAVWASARLVLLMGNRGWLYLAMIIAYCWLALKQRDWMTPALVRGMLNAKTSKLSGLYRDAHSVLAQHAESIISFGGVAAETRRIRERFQATMEQMRAWNRQMVKEAWAKGISRRIFENTFTQSLYQIPVLSALHPLKVPDTAPERVRMQANADLLAEMRL